MYHIRVYIIIQSKQLDVKMFLSNWIRREESSLMAWIYIYGYEKPLVQEGTNLHSDSSFNHCILFKTQQMLKHILASHDAPTHPGFFLRSQSSKPFLSCFTPELWGYPEKIGNENGGRRQQTFLFYNPAAVSTRAVSTMMSWSRHWGHTMLA